MKCKKCGQAMVRLTDDTYDCGCERGTYEEGVELARKDGERENEGRQGE